MRKPKVNTNPVANRYALPTERIVEYSTSNGLGGLISFMAHEDGTLSVSLYRHDAAVLINVADAEG